MAASVDRVLVFDTTLRDGEQSPGLSFSTREKLEIAQQLVRLKVDVIEAGFPVAGGDDFKAVQAIAAEVGGPEGPVVCALARTLAADIDRAWAAVRPAARPRLNVFVATSDLHLEAKLGMSHGQLVERVADTVAHARQLCDDVEFSAEDASRSDPQFLVEVIGTAIAQGAATVNIADTVGYSTPFEMSELIAHLRSCSDAAGNVVWSVHCHNDLGLATANTLAALGAGARQAEVTVNGIGERAGNASLEQVVTTLGIRSGYFGLALGIDMAEMLNTSHLVSRLAGVPESPNRPIVGSNAFAHESGIHQDGVLKDPRTYEVLPFHDFGRDGTQLVLGKHSGRHGFFALLESLGVVLSDREAEAAYTRFKARYGRDSEKGRCPKVWWPLNPAFNVKSGA